MRFLQAVTDAAQVGDTLVGGVTEVCTQPVEAVPEAAIMEPVQYGGATYTFSFIVILGVIAILILFGILIVKLWKQGNKVEHLERKVDSHLMTQQQYQQHQQYIQHLRQNQAMGSQHQDDGTNNMPNG